MRFSIRSIFLIVITIALSNIVGCASSPSVEPLVEEQDLGQNRAVLGPGDVIEIRVFGEEDLSGTHKISPEGTVRLPLIGRVYIVGLTSNEVTEKLTSEYNKDYLRDAQISVYVTEFNSRKVYVLGQVKTPGPFDYDERMTVIGAIARAGGVTRIANAQRTVITRIYNGQKERLFVDINKIGRGTVSDMSILPGDIIFVPESSF